MKRVLLSDVRNGLSRFLCAAEKQKIVITRHGRPAGVLIGFEAGSGLARVPVGDRSAVPPTARKAECQRPCRAQYIDSMKAPIRLRVPSPSGRGVSLFLPPPSGLWRSHECESIFLSPPHSVFRGSSRGLQSLGAEYRIGRERKFLSGNLQHSWPRPSAGRAADCQERAGNSMAPL
ncbi:MAG: type II toxin-antitoxin system Phd/YefM family antitoxin, partial [Acetobacteraceae bacterium]